MKTARMLSGSASRANQTTRRTANVNNSVPEFLPRRPASRPGQYLRGRPRFHDVDVPLLVQFWIALFTGMVAVTLVPPLRKSIPQSIEVGLWLALIVACVMGLVGVASPVVRELTWSTFWGADQIITTMVGLLGAGIIGWISEHRFPIATCVVLVYCLDVMALALLGSYKESRSWQPQVLLGEWMELPRLTAPGVQPVVVPYAIDEINRKWAAASAVTGAAILNVLIRLSIWGRDVLLPRQTERLAHAAAIGRVGSRARLGSIRDTALQLQFAVRAWYAAAGVPVRATGAVPALKGGQRGAGTQLTTDRMADISVLLGAQSIGWYGPLRPALAGTDEGEEEDGSKHTGRLAS